MSIQHVFFSTSTYFDLVWVNVLLDLTKNAGKSWYFLYLSFSILLLKFLTLPLTVLICLRKFPTSSDFIWRKWNFILHSKFNRLNSLKDFRIGKIIVIWLDYIMYQGMGLAFNQEHQALYVTRCWCHWLLNSSIMALAKCALHSSQNHWLGMSFFYDILRLVLGSFIKIEWC